MKRLGTVLVFVLAGLVVLSISLWAQAEKAQYIGSKKCKMCHMSKKKGEIFGIWQSSPHAKAYATLATAESKEVTKKAGIKGDPQQAAECLKCHITGYGASAEAKAASFKINEGVGCEACHGPGSLYKSIKVMRALRADTQDAQAVAFVKGDKETCLTCHNEESPTYRLFKFEEKWPEIAHPVPKAAK